MKKFIFMITAACLVCFGAVMESSGFDDTDAGVYLWRMINDARANPVKTIENYQIDMERARAALGDRAWVLELNNGLPPLAWNNTLAEAAHHHAADMVENMYYDYTSLDGRTIADRIFNAGYDAEKTGENLGLLSFENLYVDPVEAAEKIFTNMIRDALNPDIDHPANIFSIDMTQIGVSFTSAVFSWENIPPLNVYLATIDFARPVEQKSCVMGNIYFLNQDDDLEKEEDSGTIEGSSPMKSSLSRKSVMPMQSEWIPEQPVQGVLYLDYMNGEEPVTVKIGKLGFFQLEIPINQYFMLSLYDNEFNRIKTLYGLGLNINQMLDIEIVQ
ncbi:MAG: CAP domain-containing protein [Thermodesulfobacteriota bacterium]|nr:CAP domain-containing protein [Thermodesulfobacteriota bacterium]